MFRNAVAWVGFRGSLFRATLPVNGKQAVAKGCLRGGKTINRHVIPARAVL